MIKMKPQFTVLFLVSLFMLDGCAQRREQDRIGVAVSVLPQSQFVERVGGDRVRVTVMVPAGANPHTYEPTPGQLIELSKARMYAKVGSSIEFELTWLDKIIQANKKMLVVDCSKGIELSGIDHSTYQESGGRHHEAMDPHIWVSPRNAITMVENIYKGLVSIDPQGKNYYKSNMDEYIGVLTELDGTIEQTLAGKIDRKFIVYHPSWGYLAKHYNLRQLAVEEEGKAPTARGIKRLVEQARKHNINIVFASPQFSTESAEVVAKEIGGRIVLLDPLEKDYVNNMQKVIEALAEAMK